MQDLDRKIETAEQIEVKQKELEKERDKNADNLKDAEADRAKKAAELEGLKKSK